MTVKYWEYTEDGLMMIIIDNFDNINIGDFILYSPYTLWPCILYIQNNILSYKVVINSFITQVYHSLKEFVSFVVVIFCKIDVNLDY